MRDAFVDDANRRDRSATNDCSPEKQSTERESREPEAADAAHLFARHRNQLSRAVSYRMDARLRARVDCDDILQEAYLEISRRFAEFENRAAVPFYVWARQITMQVLIDIQRQHLGAAKRDVTLEIPLFSQTPAQLIPPELVGSLTSPSDAALRQEVITEIHQALEEMSQHDQEILFLRHIEELTNKEAAAVLKLDKSTVSRRYLRAMERLRTRLTREN